MDILEIFPGMADIQALAKKVQGQIKIFFRRTLQSIIEIGNYLKEIESEVKDFFGSSEGEARFLQWLESPDGVGSPELVLSMMAITSWYNGLKPEMQRLIINKTEKWSFSALKRLSGLSNELIKQLIKEEKQTLKSIERAIATSLADELAPLPADQGSRPVTLSDWSSLRKKFGLRPRHIKVLKQKAESLASLETSTAPVVKVSHVNEAIAQCKEDPELLNQPAKKAKKNKTDNSTPAESRLQDNDDEAITELISSAIAGDMEKKQAADSEAIDKLRLALAEKEASIAAQKEQMTSAIAGELEKAAHAHQEEMESLRQALEAKEPQSPPVEGMFTQEQVDEALAREREKRKEYRYTFKDLQLEVDEARSKMYTAYQLEEEITISLNRQRAELEKELYTFDQVEEMIEEASASMSSTADAEKLASLEQALAQKDRAIASLEEQTAAAVAQALAEEKEKMDSVMASQIASLEQALAQKDRAIASLKEQQATATTKKIESLQRSLAEKDNEIASMSERLSAAVAEARADERESIKAATIADMEVFQAAAIADIEVLQEEIKKLRAQNHSLMAAREQLVTASSQIEELKSQLAETEQKYSEKTRLLERDFNSIVKNNRDNLDLIKMYEKSQSTMHHENRTLKDELAGYKNIEKRIQSNYAKIEKAERLKEENTRLKENLQGQMDQSVLLSSRVTQLNQALSEISYMQRTLAKKGIPGLKEEYYVSPLNGQTYQGIKGIIQFVQDMVNNNFNVGTT